MGRFYFHVREGGSFIKDPDGVELDDMSAARDLAVASAREILVDSLMNGEPLDGKQFEISDENDVVLEIVRFRDTYSSE
jgi:hypothetical protein